MTRRNGKNLFKSGLASCGKGSLGMGLGITSMVALSGPLAPYIVVGSMLYGTYHLLKGRAMLLEADEANLDALEEKYPGLDLKKRINEAPLQMFLEARKQLKDEKRGLKKRLKDGTSKGKKVPRCSQQKNIEK